MIQNIEAITLEKFIEVYKEGEIKKGKNLIAFEVAKRNIYNFLIVNIMYSSIIILMLLLIY